MAFDWNEVRREYETTNITLSELAEKYGIKYPTIKSRNQRQGWSKDASKNASTVKDASKRKGAPKGNTFAKGHGPPKGSKNAAGNKGGHGGPVKNTKAVRTGEHQSLWMDALTDEEQEQLQRIDLDPISQINDQIVLYTWRESEMMRRIRKLKDGLSESQKRELQELKSKKDVMTVHDEKTGVTKSIPITREELVVTRIEETTYRVIEDILRIEDALTRVSDKKLKAIELKQRFVLEDDPDDEGDGLESLTAAIKASKAALLQGGK